MTGVREARRLRTREALLVAARDLFARNGYAATTVEEIAAGAGTTKATLYAHFPSKTHVLQELVTAVDAFFAEGEDAPLTDVVAAGDPDAVRGWLARTLEQWRALRPSLAMIGESDAEPRLAALVERWNDATVARMARGLDIAQRFPPETRTARGLVAFGALEALSRRYARGAADDAERAAAVDALTLVWLRLLASPPCR